MDIQILLNILKLLHLDKRCKILYCIDSIIKNYEFNEGSYDLLRLCVDIGIGLTLQLHNILKIWYYIYELTKGGI